MSTQKIRIQLLRNTTEGWATEYSQLYLKDGELGLDTDTGEVRMGYGGTGTLWVNAKPVNANLIDTKADVYYITGVEYTAQETPSQSWIGKDFGGAKVNGWSWDYSSDSSYYFSSGARLSADFYNGPPTIAFHTKDGEIIYLEDIDGQYPTAVGLPFILPDDVGTLLATTTMGMDLWIQFSVKTIVDPKYNYERTTTELEKKSEELDKKADKYYVDAGDIAVGKDLSGKTLKFDTTVDYYATTGYATPCFKSSGGYSIGANYPNLVLMVGDTSNGYNQEVIDTFATYNSGTTWLMSEYTLPDDFGTITEIQADSSSFISLKDTEVDCEYNYNYIQNTNQKIADVEEQKADKYNITEAYFAVNGINFSQNGPFFETFIIIGTIDNGNTGIVAAVGDGDSLLIYYSANLSDSELTMLLNNANTEILGETINWIDNALSSLPVDDISTIKNSFVPNTRTGISVDPEYNYNAIAELQSNKADTVYVATGLASKVDYSELANYVPATDLLTKIYPVGSIYMSTNSTSPASFIGGTWERIQDRFLYGAGTSYLAGEEDGSKTHTHTLNNGFAKIYIGNLAKYGSSTYGIGIDNNPSTPTWTANRATPGTSSSGTMYINYSYNDTAVASGAKLGGSTDSANNLPPFVAVYMWKRTA